MVDSIDIDDTDIHLNVGIDGRYYWRLYEKSGAGKCTKIGTPPGGASPLAALNAAKIRRLYWETGTVLSGRVWTRSKPKIWDVSLSKWTESYWTDAVWNIEKEFDQYLRSWTDNENILFRYYIPAAEGTISNPKYSYFCQSDSIGPNRIMVLRDSVMIAGINLSSASQQLMGISKKRAFYPLHPKCYNSDGTWTDSSFAYLVNEAIQTKDVSMIDEYLIQIDEAFSKLDSRNY